MKKKVFSVLLSGFFAVAASAQHPAIGGYNVYYGDMHNHSELSDGQGSPSSAFSYARNTAHLDFFGLTDHSEFLSSTDWNNMHTQADNYNSDGVFTAFAGFEWTSDTYGHVTVLNTSDFCTIGSPTSTTPDLLIWLASRPDGVAFFNHPGHFDSYGVEFSHFNTTPLRQIIGIELWNGTNNFNEFYYPNGYYSSDNNKGYYDEANNRGWALGALGSGDNHYATWGTEEPYRTGLLASNLSRSEVLNALRARRFFSTLDKNIALSFQINGFEMGSMVAAGPDTARIRAIDADLENFTQLILYNANHDAVSTQTLNTDTVDVKIPLSAVNGDYYYVKIREADGDEAISSPIWIGSGLPNQYPLCSIVSPSTGSVSTAPATVTINANAVDPDGSVSKVEFYRGSTKLGEDISSPYSYTWTDVTPGTYSLTVRATDNSGAVSTSVSVSYTVNARPITVTADAKTKVYGESDPALTYRITSGTLQGSDTFTGSLARSSGESAGSRAITQGTLALNSNYTIIFVGANLTITPRPVTVTAAAKTKVYGNTDPSLTYSLTSGTLIGSDSFSGALSRSAGENTGTYSILQGTLTLGSSYTITYVGAILTVTVRPISVSANAVSKVYGNPDNLSYSITSGTLAGSDSFTGALARSAGENTGTYQVTQGTLALSPNYSVTFTGSTLTITTRPVTVTANSITKTYGEGETLTYTISQGSLASGDNFTGALIRAPGEDVGTYPISQGTLALTNNYILTFTGANLVIRQRPVTVAADNISKVYGDPDQLTYQVVSGTLHGDDLFTGAISRVAGEDAGAYNIVQGSLALSSNYSLTFRTGRLTITKRPLTVTADDKSKVHGTPDPALTWQITSGNLVAGDQISGSVTRQPGEGYGTYGILMGTIDAGSNYNLTFVEGSFIIFKSEIVIEAESKSKIYGDPDPKLTYRIVSGSLTEGDELGGEPLREDGEEPGSYQIKQGTLSLSDDYSLKFHEAGFNILKRPLTVTADSKKKVYGEDDPELTYTITSGSILGKDGFIGTLGRDQGEKVGTYPIRKGTLSIGEQYELSFVESDFTITPYIEILAYPNPFIDHVCFEFAVSHPASLLIEIFNESGLLVATVFKGKITADSHRIDYPSGNLPGGVYFYKVRINDSVITGRLVHI